MPITADTLTDEQIKEAIKVLDTDLAILQAALKIKTGKYAARMREGVVEVLAVRNLDADVAQLRTDLEARCMTAAGADQDGSQIEHMNHSVLDAALALGNALNARASKESP